MAIGFLNFERFYWSLDPRELISSKYFSRGFRDYEPLTQRYLFSKLTNTPHVHFLNIGANTGLWALLVGKRFPLVQQTLVEPVPLNLSFLEQNLRLNRIRAQVLPFALGDQDRKTSCFVNQTLLGMATLVKPKNQNSFEVHTVKMVKGDNLLIDSVQVILIDVEDFEVEVLKGMRELLIKNFPIVIVEITPRNFTILREYMAEIGYSDPIWLGKNVEFGPGEKNFAFEPRKLSLKYSSVESPK